MDEFPIISVEEHHRTHLSGPYRGPHQIYLYDSGYISQNGSHMFFFQWGCACWGSSESFGGQLSRDRSVSLHKAVSLARQHLKRYGVGR